MAKTSLPERQKFIDDIKNKLELNNYGFRYENNYDKQGYSLADAREMPAIKELMEILNEWIIKPERKTGLIIFPEAKRKIRYVLDPNCIKNCIIALLK